MNKFFTLLIICVSLNKLSAQKCTLTGNVNDEIKQPIAGAVISFPFLHVYLTSDNNGQFNSANLPCDTATLVVSSVGMQTQKIVIDISKQKTVNISMKPEISTLNTVVIIGDKDYNNVRHMNEVEGTLIYSGKRNDVVVLERTNANTAENIPRQVFSKVPGVYEWDFDGSGNQTSISVRGLNPHRSWEFNVRQNGYNVNSDVFGYPESHYNPATEALSRVELVRGGACLQYGPQFGGMLNYVMKTGPTDKKVDFETRATYGSNNMFNSYNAIGGQIGKLNYYGYINYRNSDGYRTNSAYTFYSGYLGLHYAFSDKLQMGLEYSRMYYVDQQAGGLTDAQFAEDPYQSTRARNFFQPDHNIPALTLDYEISDNTHLSLKSNLILGERNSVMFIAPATVEDTISTTTLEYPARQVDLDKYTSITNELRMLHRYKLGKQTHALSVGLRYSDSRTHRQQRGPGSTGTDFDLSITGPFGLDLDFVTINYALCAENLFHVTEKFSVTPSIRYEIINTNMEGNIDYTSVPFDYDKNRKMPLAGLGLQYNFTPDINIYGNFSQAYRPMLYSDLTPSGTYDVIDPDMIDSKGYNSDFGIRGKIQDYLIFDVGIFYLQYGDRIGALGLTDSLGQKYVYKTNIGTSVAKGVETLIEFHPTAFNDLNRKAGDIAIWLSAAYDNAKYVDAITSADGQEVDVEGNLLENAPEWIIRNGITYNYKFLSTTIQSSYVSEIYSDALNTESSTNGVLGVVPSYFIVDWNATFRFSSYNIKAGVNNLNNEVYFTRRINGYPGPGILPADGRTFYISVGKEF